jgi:hypothetical protein
VHSPTADLPPAELGAAHYLSTEVRHPYPVPLRELYVAAAPYC